MIRTDRSHDRSSADEQAERAVETTLSLAERAAIAAQSELRGERTGILGARAKTALPPIARPRRVPDRWSMLYVMERMEEAFRTLSRLPMATRPRGYVNSMPYHLYERGDLNAQLETYELERLTNLRNRVRIPPGPAEIARMEESLHWPTLYFDESCRLQDERHAYNCAALRELACKLDQHAAAVESIRPTVAALELSRSKLTTWASIGFAAIVLLGWVVEAVVKWMLGTLASHLH